MRQSIDPETRIGAVHLTISDLDRSLGFYQNSLGFRLHERQEHEARLGAGERDLLILRERPDARRVNGTAGLYHYAILVPSRLDLATSLKRLADTRTAVQGFSDHLVSEAIYLADPDGNGIEIYRDRPREQWRRQDGLLQMDTLPLDLEGLMAELDEAESGKNEIEGQAAPWSGLPYGTRIGHMHLHVSDLGAAEAFYVGTLGFDMIARYGPSAGFVSAGGYHHHIGYNTWAGVGVPPAPENAIGLRWFVIRLPNGRELERVLRQVREAGTDVEEHNEGMLVRDPSGNGILMVAG